MSSGIQQVVTAYEVGGYTVEQIAESYDWEVDAVRIALMQGSVKYRQECKALEGSDKGKKTFSDDAYESAIMTMQGLLSAETEAVQYRAAKFIIDETKGRNDLKATAALGGNVTLIQINSRMQKANEALKRARNATTLEKSATDEALLRGESIEVESTTLVSST